MRKLLIALAMVGVVAGCGRGGGVTGPESVSQTTAQEAISAPLQVPGRLRAVWAPASRAAGAVARLGGINAVLLQPESWADDLSSYAAWSRERGVGAIPYVGQCFERGGDPSGCWASVERWAAPLKRVGVLWGFQGIDEPALHGLTPGPRDAAISYIRSRGYDVFATEWIEYVSSSRPFKLARPAGVRWYAVTCYAYGSRTPWTVEGCAEEYARHPDWDTVVIPDGDRYNRAAGYPYDRARWEAIAGSSRGIAFWAPESE